MVLEEKKTHYSHRLYEVDIIRLVLIFLLVFYHSFAPFSGAWEPIEGFPEVRAYMWLDKLSYAFMLESFVYISGYILGFQVRTKGREILTGNRIIVSKLRRLIIPCVVFGILYIILFKESIDRPLLGKVYSLFSGVGHLWFLPMLFWCFIIVRSVEKWSLKPLLVIIVSICFSIFHGVSLPFRLDNSLYYFIFFYLGYCYQRYSISLNRFFTVPLLSAGWSLFIIVFVLHTLFTENINIILADHFQLPITKVLKVVLCNITKLICSIIGVMLLFGSSCFAEKQHNNIPKLVYTISSLCMGVYIIHQFILKLVYYKYCVFLTIDTYVLPWIAFAFTIMLSVTFSFFTCKTKIGSYLIG